MGGRPKFPMEAKEDIRFFTSLAPSETIGSLVSVQSRASIQYRAELFQGSLSKMMKPKKEQFATWWLTSFRGGSSFQSRAWGL